MENTWQFYNFYLSSYPQIMYTVHIFASRYLKKPSTAYMHCVKNIKQEKLEIGYQQKNVSFEHFSLNSVWQHVLP